MARKRRAFGHIRERAGSRNLYVRFFVGNRCVERVAGQNRTIADRKLAQVQALLSSNASLERILEEVFGEIPVGTACPTLREAIPLYVQATRGHLKASTIEGYEHVLNAFAELPWAARRLDEIDHGTLKAWRASRQNEVSGATLNRNLSCLSALFTWAVEEEYVDTNPVRRIKKLSERGRARETYLTESEARALVEAADPEYRPFLIGALATGMRRSELMNLTWASVELDRRVLTVEAENAKSGRSRTIPMSAWLYEAISPMAPPAGVALRGLHPFGSPDGKRYKAWDVRKGFERALRRCQVIPEEKKASVVIHTLRHTAASLMVAAGVPIFDVAKILGHSTLQVTMRYAHFAPEAGRSAIDALDRRLRPPAASGEGVAEAAVAYTGPVVGGDTKPVLRCLPGGPRRRVPCPEDLGDSGQSSGHTPLARGARPT